LEKSKFFIGAGTVVDHQGSFGTGKFCGVIAIGFFIFACDKIYSTPLYQGFWCNICCCL